MTLAQANAPTPDPLLAEVMSQTAELAGMVDDDVVPKLYAADASSHGHDSELTPQAILNTLIAARAGVENAGYRAPSCLLTNTAGLQKLSQLDERIFRPRAAARRGEHQLAAPGRQARHGRHENRTWSCSAGGSGSRTELPRGVAR